MVSPIRVLHSVVNMNRGGAETLIMNLYRHIDRTKIQFDFLTCKPGVFDEEIERLGGRIHRIPYISEVGHKGYIRALKLFFQGNPDYKIVHSHMDKMSGLVLREAGKSKVPVRIAHSHNTRSEGKMIARIYKWYAGIQILSSATCLIACSNAAADWLFKSKANSALILKNGISISQFAFSSETRTVIRDELGITNDTLVIGHVGRFAPQKNHTQLIDIFHQLQQGHPNSLLLLAGDGFLRPSIEQKVNDLNISSKVRFLGIRSDIELLLQAFDVLVFPSHHEGLPVTLIEAQGAGLPCVISDNITNEVDMGAELVQYFSLEEEDRAVKCILEASMMPSRVLTSEALALKGYDIKQSVHIIEQFYLSQAEVKYEDVNRIYAHV